MTSNKGWVWVAVCALLGGCALHERKVSFQHDVRPILQANCIECHVAPHGEGYRRTGLSVASYADLMRGTIYGPVIVPGDSRHSILNMLVEGRASRSMRMPHDRDPLAAEQIETLRRWVDSGAPDN
jgi:hypothetical protein